MGQLIVNGTVTDAKGNSIGTPVGPPSVAVYIGRQFVGSVPAAVDYEFMGQVNTNEPVVRVTVIASCPGYASNRQTVPLLIGLNNNENLHNVVNFVLTPLGALKGIIFDASTDGGVSAQVFRRER